MYCYVIFLCYRDVLTEQQIRVLGLSLLEGIVCFGLQYSSFLVSIYDNCTVLYTAHYFSVVTVSFHCTHVGKNLKVNLHVEASGELTQLRKSYYNFDDDELRTTKVDR
jgi:hypothetical protein